MRGKTTTTQARYLRPIIGTCAAVVLIAATMVLQQISSRTSPRDSQGVLAAPSPQMIIRRGNLQPDDALAPNVRREIEGSAMDLVFASLSPSERVRVLDELRDAVDQIEARMFPLALDLGEGDPAETLRSTMVSLMPAYSAAYSLSRGTWTFTDATVHVVPSCEGESVVDRSSCVPLWGDAVVGSEQVRQDVKRARYAVWSMAHAAVFELVSIGSLEEVAKTLRERALQLESTIALVLTERELSREPVTERGELENVASRLVELLVKAKVDYPRQLESFRVGVPSTRAVPWLRVSPMSVVVVPRMSVLARLPAFTAEVEEALSGKSVRWIRRPTG